MSIQIYQFSKTACKPCSDIKLHMSILREEYEDVEGIPWEVVNVDTDTRGLAAQFNVTSVPSMVVVVRNKHDGNIHMPRYAGTNIAEYIRIIRESIRLSS